MWSDFSKLPVSPTERVSAPAGRSVVRPVNAGIELPIQAKLSVNQPGDPLEIEAERTAERVMRMPDPSAGPGRSGVSAATPAILRKCAAWKKEDELQRRTRSPVRAMTAPAIVDDVLRSCGRPLDAEIRGFQMLPYGAVVSSPPSEAVASVDSTGGVGVGAVATADIATSNDGQVQTSALVPFVQRAGGGTVKPEAGFVGSIQLCYDVCNGELTVVGWIWAGGGVVTKGLLGGQSWWGAYVFAEKEFLKTKLGFMPTLKCGTCDPECKPGEGATNWGGGIAGFPVALKPGERASLKELGIEVGVLLSARSKCDADLEIIALLDLTKYLGPVGGAVVAAEELANKLGKRFGIEIECGVGVDVSGAIHLCKSAPGGGILGITSDSAKICGGGYVGCGIGLAHDKSALPGI